jgi:hypothetical protein
MRTCTAMSSVSMATQFRNVNLSQSGVPIAILMTRRWHWSSLCSSQAASGCPRPSVLPLALGCGGSGSGGQSEPHLPPHMLFTIGHSFLFAHHEPQGPVPVLAYCERVYWTQHPARRTHVCEGGPSEKWHDRQRWRGTVLTHRPYLLLAVLEAIKNGKLCGHSGDEFPLANSVTSRLSPEPMRVPPARSCAQVS